MAGGEVLKFPKPGGEERKVPFRPAPVFETFGVTESSELLTVAQQALSGAESLLEFIHKNRDLAHHCGIETLGVEIVAIMEGGRFSGVVDALEDAIQHDHSATLSRDGLAILRRMETLLAEASANIRKFSEGDFSVMEIVESRARREADYHKAYLDLEERRMDGIRKELASKEQAARRQAEAIATLKSALGASNSSSSSPRISRMGQSSDFPLWIPFAIFGAIAIVAVVVVAGKK